MVEPQEELHPRNMVVDRVYLEDAGSGAGSTPWSPGYRWQWGHPRSCQEPSDAGSQAWVAFGELAMEAGQEQNASFGARRDRRTAAAATPLFQRDSAPAKPCPAWDSHQHQLPGTATTLHGHVGTNADPSSRIAAVTVRMGACPSENHDLNFTRSIISCHRWETEAVTSGRNTSKTPRDSKMLWKAPGGLFHH